MDYLYSLYAALVSINVPNDKARAVGVRQDLDVLAAGLRKDLELLSTTMTVKLGSMLVVGFGVMIALSKYLPD
ncbi:MAG: hypothetical protein EXR82_02825 [Gammaproteobacteria bacterium]|nr:hypothetical protein [Gammaproteobacteria bacterium]